MKIYAVSDLHGHFPPFVPQCDLLLLGGDYCPTRNIDQERRFMLGPFNDWLRELRETKRVRHIVGIAGNHDFILQEDRALAEGLLWHYLQDSEIEIEGVRIYGTPWTKEFFNWAFMLPDYELREKFSTIPSGLDILLSHGPAFMRLDENIQHIHCGSAALYDKIMLTKPDSVVCGHIHEAHGIMDADGLRYYNVSYLDAQYAPKYNCINIPLKVPDAV